MHTHTYTTAYIQKKHISAIIRNLLLQFTVMNTPTPSFSTLTHLPLSPICNSRALTVPLSSTWVRFYMGTGCCELLSLWTSQDKPVSVSGNQSVTIFYMPARDHFAVGSGSSLDSVLWGLWWYISPICVDLAKQETNSPYVRLSFGLVWVLSRLLWSGVSWRSFQKAVPCFVSSYIAHANADCHQ